MVCWWLLVTLAQQVRDSPSISVPTTWFHAWFMLVPISFRSYLWSYLGTQGSRHVCPFWALVSMQKKKISPHHLKILTLTTSPPVSGPSWPINYLIRTLGNFPNGIMLHKKGGCGGGAKGLHSKEISFDIGVCLYRHHELHSTHSFQYSLPSRWNFQFFLDFGRSNRVTK